MSTKKLTAMSILAAIALTIFVAEALIPIPAPVPGVKLGLANVVTLIALVFWGPREAGMILTVRIFLGSLFAVSFSSIIFSAAGGLLCFTAMSLTYRRFPLSQLWVVSIFGAVSHNLGQLLAAAFVMGTASILVYTPLLMVSAVITGAFTGLCACYLARYKKYF